jgi:hypothetical protein
MTMRKLAFVALSLALSLECLYVVVARVFLHASWQHLAQPLIFIALFGLLAATKGNIRWIAGLLRIILGLEFVLSVADRFGLLGAPGHGVSWGDFAHFVAYTRKVNAFLPSSFAFPSAVLATICEVLLAWRWCLAFASRMPRDSLLLCCASSARR